MQWLLRSLVIALLGAAIMWTAGAFDGPLQARAQAASVAGESRVTLLTDFTDDGLNDRWYVRNDDVMGGRSLGEMSIDPGGEGGAGILTMTGDINLNGGGFTSVLMDASGRGDEADARLPDFAGVRGIRFRVRASDQPHHRPWRLRVEDDLPRRRGINFRGLMTFNIAVPANQWQTVTVWLQHLRPTASGRELDPAAWEPLDVSRIRRLGVVLNDTGAGPYELQIERIELIR